MLTRGGTFISGREIALLKEAAATDSFPDREDKICLSKSRDFADIPNVLKNIDKTSKNFAIILFFRLDYLFFGNLFILARSQFQLIKAKLADSDSDKF